MRKSSQAAIRRRPRTVSLVPVAVLCLLAAVAPRGALGDAAALRRALDISLPGISPIRTTRRAVDADLELSPADEDIDAVLAAIVDAEKSAANGQWVKAAARFQEVLDRHGDAIVPAGPNTYLPAWRYCTIRLIALGAGRGLAAYRASYGVTARRAFEEARSARSPAGLRAAARHYGATRAGLDALDVLASLELERGRPASCARICLRRLALDTTAREYEPRLLGKLALALARSGRRERLAKLAAAVRTHYPAARIISAGTPVKVAEFIRSLLDATPATAPQPRPGAILPRAARPGALLWQVPIRREVTDTGWSTDSRTGLTHRKDVAPELAMFGPVARNGVLYCQSLDDLKAIDAFSGHVLWQVEMSAGAVERDIPRPRRRGRPFRDAEDRVRRGNGILSPTVARNAVMASLSTQLAHKTPQGLIRGSFGRMDALPLMPAGTPGVTLWSVNTRAETRRKETERALPLRFVSRPAVVGDVVCVGARDAQNDAFLVGYAMSDGRRLWRTKVAAAHWTGSSRGRNEIPDGSPIAARDGIAYHCNNLGTVAAVDAADGSLIWVTRYESDDSVLCRLKTIGGQEATVTAPPNAPLMADGTLFVLPTDSRYLYALDAATGAVKWRHDRNSGEAACLYLLAAGASRVYLSGSAVACLDAKDGALAWRSVLLNSFPVGRGLVARDYVMCPIEGQIAMVDVRAEGRLAEAIRWLDWARSPAAAGDAKVGKSSARRQIVPVGSGNMMALDDLLVVTRDNAISVFASRDAEQALRGRARREPGEPRHWLKLGALYLSTSRLKEAADAYQRARGILERRGAGSAAAKRPLVRVYKEMAADLEKRKSPAEAADALGKALALEQGDPRGAALTAVRRAMALAQAKDVRGALAGLHDVIRKWGAVELAVPDGLFGRSRGLTSRADVLASAKIAELIEQHGRRSYEEYELRARTALRSTADKRSAAGMVRQLYPNSKVATDARLRGANEMIRERRFAAAAGELLAVERLCPGYRVAEISALRRSLARAAAPPEKRPRRDEGKLLATLWRVPMGRPSTRLGEPSYEEAAADPGARGAGPSTGDKLWLAMGKSLRAYDPVDGKPVWKTGVGWLGVSFDEASVSPSGMPRPVMELQTVHTGHPAHKAGLRSGDLLLSFDGEPIRKRLDLIQLCGTTPPGKQVEMVLLRPGRSARDGPRARRLVLRTVIGNRPDSIARALPDGTHRNLSLAAEPHEYIRVVGAEGRSIIAEVDMALLWIDAKSGRTIARTLVDTWEPSLRTRYARYRLQMARGPRPVIGDGLVVAATPTGRLICFDLDPLKASRRWTVNLPDGLAAFRLALWNGRVAVLARQGGFGSYARALTAQLFVFDAFSGFEILHDTFPSRGGIEECNLVTAGRKLIVSVPQRLLCYDARAGRNLWSIDGRKVGASHFPEVTTMAGRVVALMNRHAIFAADLDTRRILWKKTATSATGTGSFQRIIRGRDRVFVAHQGASRYSVVCHRLSDGKRLWETLISDGVALHTSRDPVPFAQVAGDRLFIVQHLMRRGDRNPRGRAPTPSIAAIRISDGKLLRHVGLAKAAGYNSVLGGKISTDPKRATVIGLITESGLIGISTDGE